MSQIPHSESLTPFSVDALNEIYQKLTFPQRARIFEFFMPKYSQFPKKNPPYTSSIFPQITRQIIFALSCILWYFSNEWIDEPILSFLSTLSTEEGISVIFLLWWLSCRCNTWTIPLVSNWRNVQILFYFHAYVYFLPDKQVSLCSSETQSWGRASLHNLLDLNYHKTFIGLHVQRFCRSVHISNNLFAEWPTSS